MTTTWTTFGTYLRQGLTVPQKYFEIRYYHFCTQITFTACVCLLFPISWRFVFFYVVVLIITGRALPQLSKHFTWKQKLNPAMNKRALTIRLFTSQNIVNYYYYMFNAGNLSNWTLKTKNIQLWNQRLSIPLTMLPCYITITSSWK